MTLPFGKFLLSACAVTALSAGSVYADVGNITITATKNAVKVAKTPSKVNIITAKQLKEKGIIYVKDALKDIPGIAVSSNGAFGGATSTYVRGLSSYYTKVLIDGIDVSDPSMPPPQFDFANLTTDDIKRIEIVQGAQSGLYGANAVAGVVNIITKKGKGKPYAKYSQKAGSFHTYKETGESGGSLGKFNYYIEGSRLDTDGISKMDKRHSDGSYSRGDEKDGYHKTGFSSRMEYAFDDSFTVGNVLKLYKTRNYLDNGWSPNWYPDDSAPSNNTPTAKSLRDESHFFMSKFYIDKTLKNFKIDLNAFYMQNLRYYKSPSSDYKGKRWGENVKALYTINRTKITAGIDHTMEKYEDNSPFKKLRYNVGGFLEVEQSIKNLVLQGAAREDHYKTFGNHFTYKLGANYLVMPTNTILKANYSTGFRAPSIYELYAPPVPAYWFLGGNSKLTPERSKSWDFGFVQNLYGNKINLGATYFKNIIRNRIAYYHSTYKNVKGKTVSDGIELEAKIKPIEPLVIGANYTYTRSKDPDTGEQAARIPLRTYTGYITLKALNNKLINTISGRYIGKRFDDANHTNQTGKYAVFDFTSIYNFNKNLEASVSVKNIFNRFYEEVYGYSTLPRSVFARISYKF